MPSTRQDFRRARARFDLGLSGKRLSPEMRKLPGPAANIGAAHPDYGMTVAEHIAAKRERAEAAAAQARSA